MADPSGFGEGETFIGDATVITDGNGDATFTVVFAGVPAGEAITATATDIAGNTSEFSGAITVEPHSRKHLPYPRHMQSGRNGTNC